MTVREKLAALREKMTAYKMDMYLIGSEDFHGSEYVGEHFKCRAFISGFTGSAGTILVTQDFAGLWTDGRYFLQAEAQTCGTALNCLRWAMKVCRLLKTILCHTLKRDSALALMEERSMPEMVRTMYAD